MNIAVIKSGGKQYLVHEGDILKVEKLGEDSQKEIEFQDILNDQKVSAKVIETGKLEKVRILKFKPKKRYKRNRGHRQLFSKIEIVKIK